MVISITVLQDKISMETIFMQPLTLCVLCHPLPKYFSPLAGFDQEKVIALL